MKMKRLSPPHKQSLFRQIEATTATEEIANSLIATGDARASRLSEMMLDPAYARMSFAQLCSRVGLSAGDVMRLYCQKQASIAMMRMAQQLPDIMENLALPAIGQRGLCVKCAGKGTISGSTCTDCCGSGEFRTMGDIRALRLVFEITGVTHRSGRN